ncbi:MAG TPA: protein kinase [Kofleriaceae bacterium]|nr:protein kinase [Kofleriaceae bacterium]
MPIELTAGTIVDRYRVMGAIGAGSMGDVVKAVDVDLNRQVALKILSERHRDNQELRARFVREGRAVAAIQHANVVQVFTTGQFDGRPYIAMELLDGVDLGSVVKQHGVMSSVQAARAALDAARGLEAAANAGLIHRDVKPSNLVLLRNGVVKVTDFGLAKPLDPASEPALTAMGVVVGTPDYIAPEQARGEEIDSRVDIYALGGTIYYLTAGDPPFRTGNPQEDKYLKVVARHLKDPPPDARAKNPTIDAELATVALRMMSKKPKERPGYQEVIATLSGIVERLQHGGAASSPQMAAASSAPATVDPTPFVGGARRRESDAPPAARSSGWLIAVTVLSALVFLAGLGLLLFGPRAEGAETPVARPAVPPPPPDAAPPPKPDPVAPAGMLLVRRPDGTPWLFIGAAPVSLGDYSAARPTEKKPGKNKRENRKPVLQVSYDQAHSYARFAGGRLPTPEEYAAAAAIKEFSAPAKLLEWVDDGARGAQTPRSVRGAPDVADKLRPTPHANVTFRLAKDL